MARPVARERALWAEMWAKPQAVEWQRQAQQVEVAMYVRRLVEAEQRGSAVNLSTLVRQMADSLGLTTPGLRANRWKIKEEAADVEQTGPVRPSARDRLKQTGLEVVPGGG